MIIRQIACASTFTILSSLLGLIAVTPAAHTMTPSAAIEQNKGNEADTLRQGLPGRRLGGGTRSERIFNEDYVYLTALVTADNLSTTVAEYPSFMFYVPEMVQEQKAEFVLRNANDELVYETTVQISQAGGLISISTATTDIDALNIDENYMWYFSIVPNAEDRANDVVVYGNIQRVGLGHGLPQQTMMATSGEQTSTEDLLRHAQQLRKDTNLWHDAAHIVGNLHQENPQDEVIAAEWNRLLEVAGLAAVLEI